MLLVCRIGQSGARKANGLADAFARDVSGEPTTANRYRRPALAEVKADTRNELDAFSKSEAHDP